MTRRRTDPDDGTDRTAERRNYPVIVQRLNGHTRWIVTAVSTAILGLAVWGIKADRDAVERRLDNGDHERVELRLQLNTLAREQAASLAESRQFREEALRSLERIENNSKVIVKAVK